MISKKKIFTLCLLLVLLSMASVNAVDDNTTIQTDDTSNEGIIENEADIPDVNYDNVEDDDTLSFEDLQRDIDNASEGDEIELNNDYSLENGGTTIKIRKSITINGNNHTISGDYQDRILSIPINVKKVVFKNIIFEEANTTEDGGAIYNPNSETSIDLINCVFQYNTASDTYRDSKRLEEFSKTGGGAVYTTGNLNIINSEFRDNNILIGRGAAIYSGGKLVVNNTSFTDNVLMFGTEGGGKGSGLGGAIYSIGTCTIDHSVFHHNTAGIDYDQKGTYGGAIYSKGNVYVYNSSFNENEAKLEDGGAIYCEGNLYGSSVKFFYNKAYCGGAIYCKGKTHINNSEFKNNMHDPTSTFKDNDWIKFLFDQATPVIPSNGGAIYSGGTCYIDSCKFDSNLACEHGGAIYADSDLIITGENSFTNNSAQRPGHLDLNLFKWKWMDKDGGAIYCAGDVNIKNANFSFNSAFVDGGAIYCEGKTTISNSNFKNNTANGLLIRAPTGGAIRSNGLITLNNCSFEKNIAYIDAGAVFADGKAIIINSKFNDNQVYGGMQANYGGAVRTKGSINVTNSSFKNNYAYSYGGAIYAGATVRIQDSTFENNHVEDYDGGAIYSEDDVIIDNSKFKNNKANGDYLYKSYGGAVCSKGTVTAINSIFEDNHSNRHGGAIYAYDEAIIKDSSFKSNSADIDGGAIYTDSYITVSNSKFKSNSATGEVTILERSFGGAIRSNADASIKNSTFEDNFAYNLGGAIHVDGGIEIEDSTFNKNKAHVDGGAVYATGKTTISDSIFKVNNATGKTLARSFGGAVRSLGEMTVEDCLFEDNYAYNHGGAIYADEDIHVIYSNFTDNRANVDGGAIYSDKEATVSDSEFNHNVVTGDTDARSFGGAIRSNGLITLTNSKFYDNYADNLGGAVYADGEIRITGCHFQFNGAKTDGGAVYTSTIVKTVKHSTFLANDANKGDGGAIYINNKCNPKFVSCRFEDNVAYDEGGAIYLDSSHAELTMTYCTFVDNSAHSKGKTIYNCGYYNKVEYCWHGENNPDHEDQFKIWHKAESDEDFIPTKDLSIHMKINATDIYMDNNYKVTVYFDRAVSFLPSYDLTDDILHSEGHFGGDGDFYNIIADKPNNMTANVNFNKTNPTIRFRLDNQVIKLSIKVKEKSASATRILSCDDVLYPNSLNVDYEIDNMTENARYLISLDGIPVVGGKITVPKSTLTIDNLDLGNYNIRIINGENDLTYSSSASAYFKVYNSLNSINVTADNVTYGEYTTISLRANLDGLYNVNINNINIEMEVIDGQSKEHQILLDAGNYQTHTTFVGKYVEFNCSEALFTVSKANPEFKINVSRDEFNYGEEILVTHKLAYGAGGYIEYTLNNAGYANLSVSDRLLIQNLDSGSYLIDAIYSGDNNFYSANDSVSFRVNKLPNNVVVSADNVTYGQKTSIIINADIDGIYQVDVNGTVYDVTVNNGVGIKSVILNSGVYFANVTFDNYNYIIISKNTTFEVYKADIGLKIFVFDELYPDKIECIVYASKDGEYILTIADYTTTITVNDNIAYYEHDTLDVGSYEATVTFNGDENHNPVSNKTTFTVYPQGTLFEIEVNPAEVTYGESAMVTHKLSDGATGSIKYYLNNNTYLDELDVNDNLTLPVLNVGSYHVIAQYSGDKNHMSANDSTFFTVNPATNNVIVNVANVTYGEDSVISVHADVDGDYSVEVNNNVITVSVNNGIGNKSIKLNAGEYYANVTFNHDNYITIAKNTTFTVNRADNNVFVHVDNKTYGEDSVISLYADADDDYTVIVDERRYNINVENGVGNLSLKLNAGIYIANVTYNNNNYNNILHNATFRVYQADIDLIIVVFDEVYPDEVECIVYASKDGEYNLTIADHTTTITVKDNLAYYEHDTLDAGTYQATVSYSGDKNYYPAFNITTFSVYPVGTMFEIDVIPGEVLYGQTAVVRHKISEDATGNIKYYLSNNTYLDELNVKENLTLPVLNVGNYIIIASYSGDHNYIPANDSTFFTVKPAINNVVVNVDNVTYGENTLIGVSADVDGDYIVDVNGTSYNIRIKDGVGNRTLSLDAGLYYANVTFEDKNYITNSKNTTFTVNKALNNVKVTAQNVTYGEDTIVEITADVDGDYKLDVNNKVYDITVNHGVANKTIRLNAGNYYANVTFDNKNYDTIAENTIFTVYKADVDLVVVVFGEVYPDEVECLIYANNDGEYNLTIADYTTTITVKDNIGYYEHDTLDAGTYEATVSFNGDSNYNPSSNKTTFTVYPINTLFEIEVNPAEVTYGQTATVTHNLTTGATGTINYYLTNGTLLDELDVDNNLTLPVLDIGSNVIIAVYSGDKNHISANDSTVLTVKAVNNDVVVNANNVTYGEDTFIEVSADVDGEYILDVNGKLYNITVINGIGNKTLTLNAGKYYANVTFDNKNYNTTYNNTNFQVYKANTNIEIKAYNIIYPEAMEGTIQSNVDGKYYLTVGDYSTIVIVNDGRGMFNLGVYDTGSYNITVNYSGDNNHNPTTSTKEIRVNPGLNNVVVSVNNVTYTEDTLIEVSADVDGIYQVDINQTVYDVPVKNGTGNITLTLNAGVYYANVTYDDKNYHTISHNVNFEVYKADTNIFVLSPNIYYPEELEVYVYSDVDGKYNLSVGNYSTIIDIEDYFGEYNAGILDAGEYLVNVSYDGDSNHNPATTTRLTHVNPGINDVIVSVNNVTYPENTLLEVATDVDGNYILDVNGKLYNITIINGHGNKTLTLNAGKYYANVTFDNKNYNTTYNNTNFQVYKADTNITIVASDIEYPQELEGIIKSDVDGEYNLSTEGYSTTVIVKDGMGQFNLGVLDAGSYNITVNYNGDSNHNPASENRLIMVKPALNNAIISVDNVTYGDDTLIEVTADVDGIYQVDLNQSAYDVPVKNGTGNITLTLNAGIYYANLTYEDKNYNTISHNANFEVYKADTNIFVVTQDKIYPEELEGRVYSNVDGKYNLCVDNYSTVIDVIDGIGEYNAGILDAGKYLVIVSYDGDMNHYANTSSNEVSVNKTSPDIILKVSDIDYGEVEIVYVVSDYSGWVNVTVNNVTETLELNGQINEEDNSSKSEYVASLSIYDFDSGSYPVTVVYYGNKNVESVSVSGEFKVSPVNVSMDVQAIDINVGEDEIITVKLPEDVNGTVTVTVDGKDYTEPVKDAMATIIIPDLTAGNKNAEVSYSGDMNHNPAMDSVSFNVNKLESIITTDDLSDYIGENITFTARIKDKQANNITGGKVIFKLNDVTLKDENGDTIYAMAENGIASISYYISPAVHAKSYKITAVYGGNDEYLGSRFENAVLSLENRQAEITIDTIGNVKVNQTINFHVTVTDKLDNNRIVNGHVIFKLNGKTLKDDNNETLQVPITDNTVDYLYTIGQDYPAKEYTITTVLINRTYTRCENDNKFIVSTTQTAINLDKITTNTDTAQLTGTITDSEGNNVIGTNKVAVKIDGITIKNDDNTTQLYYANDGVINITLNISKLKDGEHIIGAVTPARGSYTQTRSNTTLSVNVNTINTSNTTKQVKTTNKPTTNTTTYYNDLHDNEKQVIEKSVNKNTKSNINKKTDYKTIKSYKTNKNTFITFENNQYLKKGNVKPDTYVTLSWLNDIFKYDFKNKTLLIYIDNILVFNATTSDNPSEVLFKVLEQYEGKHALKVVEGNETCQKEVNLI